MNQLINPETTQTITTKSSLCLYAVRVFPLPRQSCGWPRGMPGCYQSRPRRYRSTDQRNAGK